MVGHIKSKEIFYNDLPTFIGINIEGNYYCVSIENSIQLIKLCSANIFGIILNNKHDMTYVHLTNSVVNNIQSIYDVKIVGLEDSNKIMVIECGGDLTITLYNCILYYVFCNGVLYIQNRILINRLYTTIPLNINYIDLFTTIELYNHNFKKISNELYCTINSCKIITIKNIHDERDIINDGSIINYLSNILI